MTTYVIGDVHACFRELENLLVKIAFDSKQDTLWFTGDLVNRGPYPVETLEFVKSLGNKAICVLGNHDLSLLAYAYHKFPSHKYADDFAKVLNYTHKDELLNWLLHLPLLHYDAKFNALLVHAGLPPQWSLPNALAMAKEVELVLQSKQAIDLLGNMYSNSPATWQENLTGWERLRYIINCYTRLRFCDEQGKLEFSSKTELKDCPPGFKAWFQLANRKTFNVNVYFGHWAALFGKTGYRNATAIDTGCAWGNVLSAISLEDKKIFSVPYISRP